MRRIKLTHDGDTIAEGVLYADGVVVVRWCGNNPVARCLSVSAFASIWDMSRETGAEIECIDDSL